MPFIFSLKNFKKLLFFNYCLGWIYNLKTDYFKVPGAAALLGGRDRTAFGGWPQQAGTSKQTNSREQSHKRGSTSSRPASAMSGYSSGGGAGEAIAMSRFDQEDTTDDDPNLTTNPQDTLDETSLHNDWWNLFVIDFFRCIHVIIYYELIFMY